MTFTKLFSSITESSIWVADDHTRLVWITMMAMADKYGRVWAAVPGLANRARVPLESAVKAIEVFLAPDPFSRTKDNDGRRIEVIEGGWRLLNHKKYREIRDEQARREQNAAAQERFRKKSKPEVSQSKPTGKPIAEAEAEAEAEADTEAEAKADTNTIRLYVHDEFEKLNKKPEVSRPQFIKPTVQEVEKEFLRIGLPAEMAVAFVSHYESNGWKVGRNAMKNWQAACITWKRKQEQPSPGANMVIMGREYERILERMKTIRGNYGDHQEWDPRERTEFDRLKSRRDQLRKTLGITI